MIFKDSFRLHIFAPPHKNTSLTDVFMLFDIFIGQQILTPTLYMSTKLPFVNHLSIKILKFMYEPITNKIVYSEKLASNKWCFARSHSIYEHYVLQ